MGCLGRNENEMQRCLKMDKMKVIAGVLIMITLAGLPAGVQAQGLMMGWLHQIYGGKEYEKS